MIKNKHVPFSLERYQSPYNDLIEGVMKTVWEDNKYDDTYKGHSITIESVGDEYYDVKFDKHEIRKVRLEQIPMYLDRFYNTLEFNDRVMDSDFVTISDKAKIAKETLKKLGVQMKKDITDSEVLQLNNIYNEVFRKVNDSDDDIKWINAEKNVDHDWDGLNDTLSRAEKKYGNDIVYLIAYKNRSAVALGVYAKIVSELCNLPIEHKWGMDACIISHNNRDKVEKEINASKRSVVWDAWGLQSSSFVHEAIDRPEVKDDADSVEEYKGSMNGKLQNERRQAEHKTEVPENSGKDKDNNPDSEYGHIDENTEVEDSVSKDFKEWMEHVNDPSPMTSKKSDNGKYMSEFAVEVFEDVKKSLSTNLRDRITVAQSSTGNEEMENFIQDYNIDGKPSGVYLFGGFDSEKYVYCLDDDGVDGTKQDFYDEKIREYHKLYPEIKFGEFDEAGINFKSFEDAYKFYRWANKIKDSVVFDAEKLYTAEELKSEKPVWVKEKALWNKVVKEVTKDGKEKVKFFVPCIVYKKALVKKEKANKSDEQ